MGIQNYPVTFSALQAAKAEVQPQTSHSCSDSGVVHHHHHHNSWWPHYYWYPTPYSSAPSSNSSSSNEKDYTWIAIPAAIIGLVTAYFLGENYSSWNNSSFGIERLKNHETLVTEELSQNPGLLSKMKNVFDQHRQLLNEKKIDAEVGLMTKTTLLAAAGLTFSGALVGLPVLIGGGVALGVADAGLMLFRAGFKSGDEILKMQSNALRSAVQIAEHTIDQTKQIKV